MEWRRCHYWRENCSISKHSPNWSQIPYKMYKIPSEHWCVASYCCCSISVFVWLTVFFFAWFYLIGLSPRWSTHRWCDRTTDAQDALLGRSLGRQRNMLTEWLNETHTKGLCFVSLPAPCIHFSSNMSVNHRPSQSQQLCPWLKVCEDGDFIEVELWW